MILLSVSELTRDSSINQVVSVTLEPSNYKARSRQAK